MFIIACSSGAGRSSRCYDVYRRDAVLRKTVTWLMEEYVLSIFLMVLLFIVVMVLGTGYFIRKSESVYDRII